MTKQEAIQEIERLKGVIPILEKKGPVRMKHPDPSQPDIVMTAEDAKTLLDELLFVMKMTPGRHNENFLKGELQ